jgi:hypothetical protein
MKLAAGIRLLENAHPGSISSNIAFEFPIGKHIQNSRDMTFRAQGSLEP